MLEWVQGCYRIADASGVAVAKVDVSAPHDWNAIASGQWSISLQSGSFPFVTAMLAAAKLELELERDEAKAGPAFAKYQETIGFIQLALESFKVAYGLTNGTE